MDDIKVKMVKLFLDQNKYDFLCDYFIDTDEETIYIHLYLNSDLFTLGLEDEERIPTKVRKIKNTVKKDINNYLGIDVLVGSTIKDC